MYITINNIIGVDLSYPINSRKEIAVISMLSDNVQYEMRGREPFKLKLMGGSEKQILNKTYTSRELSALVKRKIILTDLNNDPQIIKRNKLSKITDMVFNLDKLDNTNNLENGRPSNTLFTCYVSSSEDFMCFEPKTTQYKKLKNEKIVSLTLRIMDQNNNIITNGPGTTVIIFSLKLVLTLLTILTPTKNSLRFAWIMEFLTIL